ncbi:hypothetical protein HEP74_00037 [Xanthomonas sp. SS]|uniref:hypothetical protein n=1 Tax=Xanthomonas sp. SS TaxID=2724122 RepID=UPI0016398B09|nr:hypothetical protein [Xanthomonas sp. SS]QNH14924.1 hypothetical protein HEP74_00037 [Xanthomonas sp. SS]
MLRMRLCVFVLAWLCAVPAFAADRLDAVLKAIQGSATDAEQVRAAVQASPSLRGQLLQLADAGQLQRIRIVAEQPLVKDHAFAAAALDNDLVLTSGLLQQLRDAPRPHALRSGDVAADNLVFVLAHLAVHLSVSERQAQFDRALAEKVAAGMREAQAKGTDFDATPVAQEALNHNMAIEANAYIAGWNAVVDAAQQQQRGTADTAPGEAQRAMLLGPLILSLRYGKVLERAMDGAEDKRVVLGADGIRPDARNVYAIATALMDGGMLEIE